MSVGSRFLIAILFSAFFIACSEKKDFPVSAEAPSADSLIPPPIMIMILADVHTVEASLLLDRNEGEVSKDKPGYYYRGIFNKYHISAERYDQNLKFYRANPENFGKMYEKVIEILEDRQKIYTTKMVIPGYRFQKR